MGKNVGSMLVILEKSSEAKDFDPFDEADGVVTKDEKNIMRPRIQKFYRNASPELKTLKRTIKMLPIIREGRATYIFTDEALMTSTTMGEYAKGGQRVAIHSLWSVLNLEDLTK